MSKIWFLMPVPLIAAHITNEKKITIILTVEEIFHIGISISAWKKRTLLAPAKTHSAPPAANEKPLQPRTLTLLQ